MDGKLKSTFIYFLTWVCLIPKPQYHHLSKWACGHTCSRIHGESLKVKISEFHPQVETESLFQICIISICPKSSEVPRRLRTTDPCSPPHQKVSQGNWSFGSPTPCHGLLGLKVYRSGRPVIFLRNIPKGLSWPQASASPGSLLEMQILGPSQPY